MTQAGHGPDTGTGQGPGNGTGQGPGNGTGQGPGAGYGPGDPPQTGTPKLRLDFPREAVARLTISNPEKRNALDHEILDAITATVPALDRGIEVRCLVITGEAPVFSAGYDIGGIPDESFEQDAEALVAHPFPAALAALESFPWPTLAAINGHCLGGGLELALTCDLRTAAAGAKMGMPPAKLGLIYGHTGVERFIRTVGAARTREIFFTGRNMAAARAESIGLVNEVAEDDALEDASLDLAALIAGNAPLSMKGNKQTIETLLAAGGGLSPEDEQALVELRESCFRSTDFREGIAAFGEKRKPRWTGT